MNVMEYPPGDAGIDLLEQKIKDMEAVAVINANLFATMAPSIADEILKKNAPRLTPARREALHNTLTDDLRDLLGTVIPVYMESTMLTLGDGMPIPPHMRAESEAKFKADEMARLHARDQEFQRRSKELGNTLMPSVIYKAEATVRDGCTAVQLHRAIKPAIDAYKIAVADLRKDFPNNFNVWRMRAIPVPQ